MTALRSFAHAGSEPSKGAGHGAGGMIGPNAIVRMAQALTAREGPDGCRRAFAAAGIARHLDNEPQRMVDEMDVARLHRAVYDQLGAAAAAQISREAGQRTADYLLAHRIPLLAQRLLSMLPRPWSAGIFANAIARHAWTFAGSGAFAYVVDNGLRLRIRGAPVSRLLETHEPACHYYSATFERVFSAVLGPGVQVVETECEASGAPACLFHLRW